MEARIIPTGLMDAVMMTTGRWFYSSYAFWFDDFLWKVFQLCVEQMPGTKSTRPSEAILDEKPGSYFFLAQLDAYRNLKDPSGITSNVGEICRFGHIAPLLFLLNYADLHYEKRHQERGGARHDPQNYIGGLAPLGEEYRFRIQLLKIAYSLLRSGTTELVVNEWHIRSLRYKERSSH